MDSLCEFFEDLAETAACPDDYDCAYAVGCFYCYCIINYCNYCDSIFSPKEISLVIAKY